ncbi:MAG: type II toxin-antitoxin system prevent-host-death family antitoxin [Deltaproteobacteria bacterium]|nr:type II toxin-antitoxin system prevent-host-death family antitoxin [Deltaproteobacteria bacterium]
MRIGLREANQHFSKTIRKVRAGRTVVLTDHGRPVAVIKPFEEGGGIEEKFQQLAEMGILHRPVRTGRLAPIRPMAAGGKPVSDLVSEERDER